jgi:hypothetical protein
MKMEIGYLQHVSIRANGDKDSFRTESVNVKHEYADNYLAFFEGKWRRVHANSKGMYIIFQGAKITIQIEGI